MRPAPERQRGFALVEAVAALAIIALMSGLLFQAIGTGASASRRVGEQRRAMLVAQSVLAVAAAPGRSEVPERGESAGFRWRIETAPFGSDGARARGWPMTRVTVTVTGSGSDSSSNRALVTLTTLRLTT